MHTHVDAIHWNGNRFERGDEAEAAKAFAKACYLAGLDVVGITDHNFLSKDFIPFLHSAFIEIERNFSHKITLFPGFEFEAAGVGRGVHILCLFDPGSDLASLDSILTECGVKYPRTNSNCQFEKSEKNLKEIIRIVQDNHAGIVILPHAMSNDGIFDNDSISEWLQQDQFTNPDLLAVEIPKPVNRLNEAFQKLFRSGDDCLKDWKRIRPIATLMSSDNKNLFCIDDDLKPISNSIGYRYSWIKMSQPSIESLRQAFLDHDSRIVLPDDVLEDKHPAKRVRISTIGSISIKDVAFLSDQEVIFSPNMNCVIGGRGSGKSTLLEYLRILLGKGNTGDLDDGTKERIKRVRDTLKAKGVNAKVSWRSADGVEDLILWEDGNLVVQGRELSDPETFFNSLPVTFYSQQQLNRLTESREGHGSVRQAQRLLELIDGFSKKDLDELSDKEQKLKLQIQDSFSNSRKAKALQKKLNQLRQEHEELDRQWKARSEIQEDARKYQQLKTESRYLDDLLGAPGNQFSDVAELADTVVNSHVPFQGGDLPHSDWFEQFDKKVKTAKEALAKTIRDAVDKFTISIETFKKDDHEWAKIQEELDQADTKFTKACEVKGLTVDDVGRLNEINELRGKKQDEITEIITDIEQLKEAAGNPEAIMKRLHKIWRDQFEKRKEATQRANQLSITNESQQRFIEVSAKFQQDHKNFCELWQNFAPFDGRTRLGRNWESCGEIIYNLFESQENAESPWQVLYEKLSESQGTMGTEFGGNAQELYRHIQENPERWEKLRCSRVQDTVDMKLFRPDSSVAGSISEGSLSDGQRNTAALALLLAQEGGPLVIDQPEDELDSNFVFRELIPMLRKVKSKRQLIMATHNANLPVNGDAELVYAFEAQGGKGEVLAQGGLDQGAVTKAVLDIMEGTEEAFRRRREKYHF